MKYLHTMLRVTDVDASLDFFCNKLGLEEVKRNEVPEGRFTLIFLAPPGQSDAQVELTYNWDPEPYPEGRNFGHLAYEVDDIYAICKDLMDKGVTIARHGMAGWPSSARRTMCRLNCCKRAIACRRRSPGPAWKTPASGRQSG